MCSRGRACRIGLVLGLCGLRRMLLVAHHIPGLLKPLDHLLTRNHLPIDIRNDLGDRLQQALRGWRSLTLRTGTAQHCAEQQAESQIQVLLVHRSPPSSAR